MSPVVSQCPPPPNFFLAPPPSYILSIILDFVTPGAAFFETARIKLGGVAKWGFSFFSMGQQIRNLILSYIRPNSKKTRKKPKNYLPLSQFL